MSASISSMEARFPLVSKGIFEFGKHTSQLAVDQAHNKNATAELAARMTVLEEKVAKLINPAA
jgi:folylpolyglutamate synthase/dihydropteroate synthase